MNSSDKILMSVKYIMDPKLAKIYRGTLMKDRIRTPFEPQYRDISLVDVLIAGLIGGVVGIVGGVQIALWYLKTWCP